MNRLFFILGRFCVLGVLAAAPWWCGGSEPRVLLCLAVAIFASAVFALAALWTTPRRERRKNVYTGTILTSIVLTLGLALGAFQLVPLSDASLERFAPRVVELKRLLLPPNAPETTLADVSKPDYRAPENLVSDATAEETERFLSEAYPFEEGASTFDVRAALAVDAAVENDWLDEASESRNAWGKTISVYPLAGREKLISLWSAAVLFVSTVVLFNTSAARLLFWRTIVANGLVFALFCVATRANPGVFYTEEFKRFIGGEGVYDWVLYGTYINKNAAGGYLVLVLSAAVSLFALEFLKTADALKEESVDPRALELAKWKDSVYRRSEEPLWTRIVGSAVELFNRRLVFAFFLVGFLLTAIFASLSRGASLAACVATLAAFFAFGVRRSARRFWPALVALLIVSILGVVAVRLNDRVGDRMSTLVVEEAEGEGTALTTDSRWENWRAALETGKNYRWFGGGLGTYSLTTRAGDVAMKKGRLFHHAENIFVETYLETGIVGLTLLAAFLVVVFGVVLRRLRGGRSFETTAVATGALALLLGTLISSSFDFGVYLPANLFLFASLVGIALGRQETRFWQKTNSELKDATTAPQALKRVARAERRERIGASILTLFVVGGLSGAPFVLTEAIDYVERTKLFRAAKIEPKEEMYASISTIDAITNDIRTYIERRDDCAELRATLASLAEIRFKLAYWEAESARLGSDVVDENAWRSTTPDYYAELILMYRRINFAKATASIQTNPIIAESFPSALTDLLAARRICPMFETTHERIARCLPLVVETTFEREQAEIELCSRRALSLAPYSSGLAFRVGGALRAARIDPLWIRCWSRSFEYTSRFSRTILAALLVMDRSSRIDEYVEQIVPNEASTIRVASSVFSKKENSPAFEAIKKKGERFFAEIPEEEYDVSTLVERALFRQKIGALEGADDDFKRAIEAVPEDSTEGSVYRYYRGVFLSKEGKSLGREEEALKLLQACDRTDPIVKKLKLNYWLKVASENWKKRQATDAVDARLGGKPQDDATDSPAETEEKPVDESKELMNSIRKRMRNLGVE